jgi:hypothetical protein
MSYFLNGIDITTLLINKNSKYYSSSSTGYKNNNTDLGSNYLTVSDISGVNNVDGTLTIKEKIDSKYSILSDTPFTRGPATILYDLSGNLYVPGIFTIGNISITGLGKYDIVNSTWSNVARADINIHSMAISFAIDSRNNFYYIVNDNSPMVFKFNTATQVLSNFYEPASGSSIASMVIDSNDNIYVCGNFQMTIGTTITYNIAKWNGTKWTPLGNGLQNVILRYIAVDTFGNVYVTYYTSAGNGERISKFDGTNWTIIGRCAFNRNDVNLLKTDHLGNLYVGLGASGRLYSEDLNTFYTGILGKYSPTTSSWSNIGVLFGYNNMDNYVYDLCVDSYDNYYIYGTFNYTTTDVSGTQSNFGKWNNSQSRWETIGSSKPSSPLFTTSYSGVAYLSYNKINDSIYFYIQNDPTKKFVVIPTVKKYNAVSQLNLYNSTKSCLYYDTNKKI